MLIVVSRKEFLEAELMAIDLWNREVANKTTLSEDEKIAFDSRTMRREAILRELLD